MVRSLALAGLAAVCLVAPHRALAWGSAGHRLIGVSAMQALPPGLPAFLSEPANIAEVGELSREPDRSKGAGRTHDADLDPGHFLDLGDDGKVFGGPPLAALPETREGYEAALHAVGQDGWKAGYLPYSIVDGWQQLVRDFAVWRIDHSAAGHVADPGHRAWFVADQAAREQLILRDIGVLSHFVGDGSQPLHVTVHFNGWGPGANPEQFTQAHVHGPIEGAFVHAYVDPAAVRADMTPADLPDEPILRWTADYLAATAATVVPLYRLEKAGGFENGDGRGRAFLAERLAAGASALRDAVAMAWRASASAKAGWPEVSVAQVEAGGLDPYDAMFGVD